MNKAFINIPVWGRRLLSLHIWNVNRYGRRFFDPCLIVEYFDRDGETEWAKMIRLWFKPRPATIRKSAGMSDEEFFDECIRTLNRLSKSGDIVVSPDAIPEKQLD